MNEESDSDTSTLPDAKPEEASSALLDAMGQMLKAARQVGKQEVDHAQAEKCRTTLWRTFQNAVNVLTALPSSADRRVIENYVAEAEVAHQQYLEAGDASFSACLQLQQANLNFETARKCLNEALESIKQTGKLSDADAKIISAAEYMKTLVAERVLKSTGCQQNVSAVAESAAVHLELKQKLRRDLTEYLLAYNAASALGLQLSPIVRDLYWGPGLDEISEPVRPIEEEVKRYLTSLESALRKRQETARKAVPLLKHRKTVLERRVAAAQTLKATRAEAETVGNGRSIASIVEVIKQLNSTETELNGSYYDQNFVENPEILDAYNRVNASAVEKDQQDFLRKQMRSVAYALAHLRQAERAQNKHSCATMEVSSEGAAKNHSWKQCLQWHEELTKKREAAEFNTLSSQAKRTLLDESVQHYKLSLTNEIQELYKGLCATIPFHGDKPCNDLRVLINMAAWLCQPLSATDAAYPVY